MNISAKLEVPSFSRSWDNSDCSFGVGLRTPNLGEGKAVGGQGSYRSKECLWRRNGDCGFLRHSASK